MHQTPKVTDARLADAIRVPVVGAAEHAGLGHPGMAFAMRGAVPGPQDGARVRGEAALRLGRDGILGETGGFVGTEGYGALAPAPALCRHFGITPKTVADRACAQLSGRA
jgi:transketolase